MALLENQLQNKQIQINEIRIWNKSFWQLKVHVYLLEIDKYHIDEEKPQLQSYQFGS